MERKRRHCTRKRKWKKALKTRRRGKKIRYLSRGNGGDGVICGGEEKHERLRRKGEVRGIERDAT